MSGLKGIKMELNRSNMKKLMLLTAFAIAFYLGLKNIYRFSELANFLVGILQPILLGLAITFILNVLMRQVEMRLFAPLNKRYTKNWPKVRRTVSIFITLMLVAGIIALVLLIVVPELVRTITSLTSRVPTFFNELQGKIAYVEKKYPYIGQYLKTVNIDWTSVSQMIAAYGQNIGRMVVNSTVTVTTNVARTAVTFILAFVISINILAQKEKLMGQAKRVLYAYLPRKRTDAFLRICSLTNQAFSNFIVGQCTEACILGTLCFIGMSIFGFPFAALVSVIVAFCALIPIIGAMLSVIIGSLLILIVSPIQAIWFAVFFLVLQQLEGNLIYPRVVGSKVGLPALWVLIAVTIGGNACGIIGMVLNIPICSVLYTLLRENVEKRLGKSRVQKADETEK
jgi:predicted PurR-regulated permease PerM